MSENDFTALVLGGGLSSRMGSPKLILPLGDETVVEKVIGLFRQARVNEIVVVLGHGAQTVLPHLANSGSKWVINDEYRSGMFSSVRKGAAAIAGKCRGFFVLPADMPLVKPDTLKTLMAAFGEEGKLVFRPCHNGRHGHPPLISSSLIPAILEFPGAGGLRAFFARLERSVADIECDDPGILEDLDTPEDYRRACERFEHGIS